MKMLKNLLIILATFIFLFQITGNAMASERYSYTVTPVEQSEERDYLNRIGLEIVNEPIVSDSIDSFDVSADGLIALGFNRECFAVSIYDKNGNFLYTYRFANITQTCYFFINEQNLTVYFVKNQYLATFSPSGNCEEFGTLNNTRANYEMIDALRIPPLEYVVGNNTYYLERDVGINPVRTFSRCIIEDSAGNRNVIYDVSHDHNIRFVFSVMLGICFCIFIIVVGKRIWINEDET